MSKTQKERQARRQLRDEQPLIPLKYQHMVAILTIFLSLIIFFRSVIFTEKTFLGSDAIAYHSWSTVMNDAKEQGIFPLWNPYIFCGMPAYASLTFGGERLFDISSIMLVKTSRVFQYLMLDSPVGSVIFYYFIFGIGMYLFTFSKLNNKIASLIASLGSMYSTYIIMWIMINHNTKIFVMAFFPFILLIIDKLRIKFDWKYALLLVILFHFLFSPAHVQMIFYSILALGIYFLVLLAHALMKKKNQFKNFGITNWKSTLRTGAVVTIAAVIAFTMDADKYLSVLEYNPYSIRGSAPIVKQAGTDTKTQEGGLGYDYATSWSFSPGEMMTFIIPSWYGFGWHEYRGKFTIQPVRVNTYWGLQPFVDGPPYMGIAILFIAVIGFIRNRKDSFVQFLAITIVFSMLVAFGREFSIVYDLMYNYFPTFNKFRVPSMILVLVQISVPILAAYGISSLMDRSTGINPVTEKKWKYSVFGLAGLLVLAFIGRSIFEDIYTGFFPIKRVGMYIARAIGTGQNEVVKEFYDFVINSVMTDLYVALALLIIVLGAFWMYLKGSLKFSTLSIILIVVVVADLWRVDFKPMEPKEQSSQNSIFATPEYVKFLQQDKSLYRTLTFIDGNPPYDNTLAYWRVQNAYGYHGAKIRAYQDMVDVAGLDNPLVWQLMNVKYIISNKPDSSGILELIYNGSDRKVYRNRIAATRAFFVNKYETTSSMDILNKMATMSFNPWDVAYLMENTTLNIEAPRAGASVEYVRYGIQDLELKATATGNNLMFLSEAYYPNGWKAFIDGRETPIYRLDYLFRGIVVPSGTHKVEMKFEPRGFYLGKNLSFTVNLLILAGFAGVGYTWWRKHKTAVPSVVYNEKC